MKENLEEKIINRLEAADIYENLAEECAELAQACSKMSRYLRGTNPTNNTGAEIYKRLIEEWSDVTLIADRVLKLKTDAMMMERKLQRWNSRLDERKSR